MMMMMMMTMMMMMMITIIIKEVIWVKLYCIFFQLILITFILPGEQTVSMYIYTSVPYANMEILHFYYIVLLIWVDISKRNKQIWILTQLIIY